jgi:demethylspheroidene O-methyltransferase
MAWRTHWIAFRNNLISSQKFQRWAASFPLTRFIARARARKLFDLIAGFVYSQALLASVQLRLFDILAEGPKTIAQLAHRLGLDESATQRLLLAVTALDLAERLDATHFALGQHGAALRGNPSLNAMIKHHALLYEDLADPVALLRGENRHRRVAKFWPYAANSDPNATVSGDVRGYSALMAESQALIASDVLDAFSFDAHRCLLDVGGGEGAFLISVGQRAPHLH